VLCGKLSEEHNTSTLRPPCRAIENFRIIATFVGWRTSRVLEHELPGSDRQSRAEDAGFVVGGEYD